jgi:hypothetical protein
VVTANSIEEVLSKFTDINPDLVILELRQTNADEGSLKKLRKQYPKTVWVGYSTLPNAQRNLRNGSNSICLSRGRPKD